MKITKVIEGHTVLPEIDRERYTEIPGLEGPFRTRSGKVVYYDPKEGRYYDRDSDMYLSHEEYEEYDRASMREGDVSHSLAVRRQAKQANQGRQQRMQQDQKGADMFATIDNAIASTMDLLIQQGMDEAEVREKIYDHLGDAVAAYDMTKGM